MTASATLAAQLAQAAQSVCRVASGRSLAEQFATFPQASRGALIDLTHGTLRRYGRVHSIVAGLARRGRPDAIVEALLWCSLYALESGRYREHTVVDEAVKACGLVERWPAKSFVNAVLRTYLRERQAIESRLAQEPEALYQHPRWWIESVRAAYPAQWQDVLRAGNGHPPMSLRVNRRRAQLDDYLAQLEREGVAARALSDEAILLEHGMPVERLPGFAAGDVSVQDAGAQRAAHCLDLRDGQRVLDACAAPGGKSAHILELADAELTALDVDASRAARIRPNLQRLGLDASVIVADAAQPETWWDGKAYDRILADVPCTASGIVRRHPDVKWLRRAADVASFAQRQLVLLRALWRVLAPGGKLLYATCSVFPGENEGVVGEFLAGEHGARRVANADGRAAQWLPDAEHDGFFYALIEKGV